MRLRSNDTSSVFVDYLFIFYFDFYSILFLIFSSLTSIQFSFHSFLYLVYFSLFFHLHVSSLSILRSRVGFVCPSDLRYVFVLQDGRGHSPLLITVHHADYSK
jgi:hypothetical protein